MAAVLKFVNSSLVHEWSRIIRISWVAGVLIHTAYIFVKSVKESVYGNTENSSKSLSQETHSQVLFFPDKRVACRQLLFKEECNRKDCQYTHEGTSLKKLVKILLKAKQNLDICVFTINCRELADAAVLLHKSGVVVRVLTDDEQMGSSGSQIEKFKREGIQVRHDVSSFFMHHKFAVIDDVCLVNGSFNWTKQAVTGNRENVVITNDENVVKHFVEEFERLWEEYDPAKR